MVELNGVRIWAVAVVGGQVLPPRKLVCGTLARPWAGTGDLPGEASSLPGRIRVPGRPELVVGWTGWFELVATGEVLAVYGAVVEWVGDQELGNEAADSRAGKL